MLPFSNYYILTPTVSEKKNITTIKHNRRNMRWPPKTLFVRERGGKGDDELATVKAAAWAWYQRNEAKPMIREFDMATRGTRTPQSTRYKLEANKNMILYENRVSKPSNDPLLREDQENQCSSTLLDPCEIKSISKRIDEGSLLASQVSVCQHDNKNNLLKKFDDGSRKENGLVKKVSMRNLWKGMILMAPRTGCVRSDDVDISAYRSGPRTVKVAPTTVHRHIHRR